MADDFIIANEELAMELDGKLELLPFRDRDTFIQMYNSGFINRKNEEVSALVDDLIAAYKGIEKRPDGITFLDMGEISADELIARAEAYSLLLRLQRIAKEASRAGHVKDGSLIFLSKANGVVRVADEASSDETFHQDQLISSEKLPKISNAAVEVIGEILGEADYSLTKPFQANRLLSIQSGPVVEALAILS